MAGDGEDYGALFEEFKPGLYRYARSLTSDGHKACDLVQETFLKLLQSKPRFQHKKCANAWLLRVLRNNWIERYRRETYPDKERGKRLRRKHPLDDQWVESPEPSSQTIAETKELYAGLRDAIEQLPDDFRQPLELHYFQGRSYSEIAEALAIPKKTAMTRVHRARAKLRDILGEQT